MPGASLRPWVCLVDGAKHQIDVIRSEARRRDVKVTVVVDFIHVLEYLWGAVWCFYDVGDPAAETWVAEKGLAVSRGRPVSSPALSPARLRPSASISRSARRPTSVRGT